MKISIFRYSGFLRNALGANVPLAIFFNDEQICSISKGETKVVEVPNCGGVLHVGEDRQQPWRRDKAMRDQRIVSSNGIEVQSDKESQRFECGTNWWVAFDLLNISYVRFMSGRVFFLRRIDS